MDRRIRLEKTFFPTCFPSLMPSHPIDSEAVGRAFGQMGSRQEVVRKGQWRSNLGVGVAIGLGIDGISHRGH